MRKLAVSIVLVILLASMAAGLPFIGNKSISDFVQVQNSRPQQRLNGTNSTSVFSPDSGLTLPVQYVALFVVFLGLVVYAVDIDPVWLAVLIFTTAFGFIVYSTSIPWYAVPVFFIILAAGVHFL